MVAVFVRNDKSQDANNVLESAGFESIPLSRMERGPRQTGSHRSRVANTI